MTSHWLAAVIALCTSAACSGTTAAPAAAPPGRGDGDAAWLDSRVGETDPAVVKMFRDDGMSPALHVLTGDERRKVVAALAGLPPLHRRVLGERLRRVSFLDGMPNAALTSPVMPGDPHSQFDITFRAGVLHETVSQLLTHKEQQCFDLAGSPLRVTIEAGTTDAIAYVMLHEATHVVDRSLGLTPSFDAPPGTATPITQGLWTSALVFVPAYQSPLLDGMVFRRGSPLPIDRAREAYEALQKLPLVSLYATASWNEDLAELLAWYHLSERLHQPYRIVIRDGADEVFHYEPMKSPGVRNRFGALDPFYNIAS